MVDYLLKFIAGLCIITLIFLVSYEQTKPVTPDLLEIQLKDDTPPDVETPYVVETPIMDRIRVEEKPLDAVFLDHEINTLDPGRQEFLDHMSFIIDEISYVTLGGLPDHIFPEIERHYNGTYLFDVIDMPTDEELLALYDEQLMLEYNIIRRANIRVDDFEVRVKMALRKGEFADPLMAHLEEYQDVLDARLDDPQKFWSAISEYEIMVYLEEQELNTHNDIPSDELYDQIMTMMTVAELNIQKDLWQNSPFLELYLALYKEPIL